MGGFRCGGGGGVRFGVGGWGWAARGLAWLSLVRACAWAWAACLPACPPATLPPFALPPSLADGILPHPPFAPWTPPAGKGDEVPGQPAQDIVFVVRQKPHPVFAREGDDLVTTQRIPLRWVPASAGCAHSLRIRPQRSRRRRPGWGAAAACGAVGPLVGWACASRRCAFMPGGWRAACDWMGLRASIAAAAPSCRGAPRSCSSLPADTLPAPLSPCPPVPCPQQGAGRRHNRHPLAGQPSAAGAPERGGAARV